MTDPTVLGANAPTRDEMKEILPDLDVKLDSVKDDINTKFKLEDPNSPIPLTDKKTAAYAALDQQIRDKMLGIGQKKGDGTVGKGGGRGQPERGRHRHRGGQHPRPHHAMGDRLPHLRRAGTTWTN